MRFNQLLVTKLLTNPVYGLIISVYVLRTVHILSTTIPMIFALVFRVNKNYHILYVYTVLISLSKLGDGFHLMKIRVSNYDNIL